MLYGPDNRPLPPSGATASSYVAADRYSQELASWQTGLSSPDLEWLPERDTVVARTRDLVRNSGWAAGGVSRHLDAVIGGQLRLSAKPDWRALGFDRVWAKDFGTAAEAVWRMWGSDIGMRCDVSRKLHIGGLLALAYRHYLVDGDAILVGYWRPDRGSLLSTAFQVIDPDRLCNPMDRPDTDLMRGGIEFDADGAAVAYNFRQGHPYDIGMSVRGWRWTRVARETAWGRPLVIHFHDIDRGGQSRGAGVLAPVIERFKMLDKYERAEMGAALLNALLAAFIESPFDPALVEQGLETLGPYQAQRAAFHQKRPVQLNGVRIATLFPGDKFNMPSAARPNTAFAAFESAVLRNIASSLDLSYEQLSLDWSQSNYSSARGALIEAWRSLLARRTAFAARVATVVYAMVLEEAIDLGMLPLPDGAPDFWPAATAYAGAKWIGPGRGWVDPTKEAEASVLRMEASLSTLEDECAEQGLDWEDVVDQRADEIARMTELGLPMPSWVATQAFGPPASTPGEAQPKPKPKKGAS